MYKIFIPTEHNNTVPFTIPREWYGKEIKFTIYPVSTKETKGEEEFMKLRGAWESDKSAEEMVAEIRDARKFRERDLAL